MEGVGDATKNTDRPIRPLRNGDLNKVDINETRLHAEEGNTAAQGILGSAYLFGEDGEDIDYAEALRWLSQAAEKGAYGPIGWLGDMYAQGLGVDKDINKAILLYKESSARGNFNTALLLARMYSQGLQVTVDTNEALRWYTVVFAHPGIDPDDEDVGEAKRYLTAIDGHEIALINLLERDPLAIVRAGAATVLSMLQPKSAIPALIKAAGNTTDTVRPAVIWALGEFKEWEGANLPSKAAVTELLLSSMEDDNDQVREAAAGSIYRGSHDNQETRARLCKALNDSYSGVRAQAAFALSVFEDETLVYKLEWLLLNDELSPLYFSAAECLGDSYLLPSVITAAERWRQTEHYEDLEEDTAIQSAIDYLTEVADDDPEGGDQPGEEDEGAMDDGQPD